MDDEALVRLLSEQASPMIARSGIGLVGVRGPEASPTVELLGSGTIVEIAGATCIMTASHVVRSAAFARAEVIGLGISSDVHRIAYPQNVLRIEVIAEATAEDEGPDLACIVLPDTQKTGWVRAKRHVCVLNPQENRGSLKRPPKAPHVWAIVGAVGEWVTAVECPIGFTNVSGFGLIHLYCSVTSKFEDTGFDYCDVTVPYEENSDLPTRFGGVSGGGLWWIPIQEHDDSASVGQPEFAGLAFYQSPYENDKRIIRCHGWNSVREIAPRRMTERLFQSDE